jgi:ADP-L-glycero-D-manno-heptose 6-epimerase
VSSTTEKDIRKITVQNIESSIYLYEDCIDRGINFQFASSASVYGLDPCGFKETAVLDPLNHYARSKAIFEDYIRYRNAPIITQVFRYFNVYGDYEDHKGEQASPYTKFRKQAKKTGKIKLFKNSEYFYRDFIHVDKIVEYHQKFFDVKKSGVWNMGTGIERSFYEIAMEICKETGATIEWVDMPENLKNSYQDFTRADTTNLWQTLSLR